MKKRSIIFTVNLTFFIAFLLICLSLLPLYHINKKKEGLSLHKRGMNVSRMFMDDYRFFGIGEQLQRDIKHFDFTLIEKPDHIANILLNKATHIEHIEDRRAFHLEYLRLHDHHFIHIILPNGKQVLLQDDMIRNNFQTIIIIYTGILVLFFFLYLSIVQKLKPLKTLNTIVKDIGREQFDISYPIRGDDEVSRLIKEFKNSAQNLKKIKESRNIFIRNIMHELKTPIAKGKFLTHLPHTDENEEKMQKVFYRLEALINEFAAIEELISTKKQLNKQKYSLEDIIDNAEDILMCNEGEVVKAYAPLMVNVDFDIFSIAIKNLLDNGIKYSTDHKVTITTKGSQIYFENNGSALTYPLENYFEPFFRDSDTKSDQSFGLGLYIVKHILDAHEISLQYRYNDGKNLFKLSFPS